MARNTARFAGGVAGPTVVGALATVASHARTPPVPPECTELRSAIAVIPFDDDEARPIVRATINGIGPFRMLVDTGASTTCLDPAALRRLGIPIVGASAVTDRAMGREGVPTPLARIDRLEIDNAAFSGVECLALSVGIPDCPGPPEVDGIIGFPVFEELLLTFDFPARRIVLQRESPPVDPRSSINFDNSRRGIPVASIALVKNSGPLLVILDTGSDFGLILPGSLAGRLALAAPPVQVSKGIGVSGGFAVSMARWNTDFPLGGRRMRRPIVSFTDAFDQAFVGVQMLRHFRVSFDQRARRAVFYRESPEPIAFPAHVSAGFGMCPTFEGSRRVSEVIPGLAASRAGLGVGDLIVRCNGMDVAGMSSKDWRNAMRATPGEPPPPLRLTVTRGDQTIDLVVEADVLVP